MPKPTGNGWVNSTVTALVTAVVFLTLGYPVMRARMDQIEVHQLEIIKQLRIVEDQQLRTLKRLDELEQLSTLKRLDELERLKKR